MVEDHPEQKRALGGLIAAVVVIVGVCAILYYLIENVFAGAQ